MTQRPENEVPKEIVQIRLEEEVISTMVGKFLLIELL